MPMNCYARALPPNNPNQKRELRKRWNHGAELFDTQVLVFFSVKSHVLSYVIVLASIVRCLSFCILPPFAAPARP